MDDEDDRKLPARVSPVDDSPGPAVRSFEQEPTHFRSPLAGLLPSNPRDLACNSDDEESVEEVNEADLPKTRKDVKLNTVSLSGGGFPFSFDIPSTHTVITKHELSRLKNAAAIVHRVQAQFKLKCFTGTSDCASLARLIVPSVL